MGGETHPLIKIITPKLHRAIRHDPDTIRPVPPHKPPPPLFPPHLGQRLAHAQLIRFAPRALDLKQNLEALERRHHGARHGARHAARAKGGHHGFGNGHAGLVRRAEALGGGRGRREGGGEVVGGGWPAVEFGGGPVFGAGGGLSLGWGEKS